MNTSSQDLTVINRINAAMISSGIGAVALGFFTVLAEISESSKSFMVLNEGVGALSGKTAFAVLIWFVIWAILDRSMRGSRLTFDKAFNLTLFLFAIGLLGTFPIFFQAFAP